MTKAEIIADMLAMAENERVWGNEGNAKRLERLAKEVEKL